AKVEIDLIAAFGSEIQGGAPRRTDAACRCRPASFVALGGGGGGLLGRRGLGHLARAEAARADAQAALDAPHHRADALEVGIEPPVRHVVGVADAVAGHRPLPADLTTLSHRFPPAR